LARGKLWPRIDFRAKEKCKRAMLRLDRSALEG